MTKIEFFTRKLTLKQLITILIAIILVFLVATTAITLSASQMIVNSHTQDVGSATLNYYQTQLDATLANISSYCENDVAVSTAALYESTELDEKYVQKVELGNTLSSLLYLSGNIHYAMILPYEEDFSGPIIRSRCTSLSDSNAMQDALTGIIAETSVLTQDSTWAWLEINSAYYLTNFFLFDDAVCAVCLDSNILSVTTNGKDSLYLFCRQDGTNISANTAVQQALAAQPTAIDALSIQGSSYTLLTTASQQGDFSISCLIASSASDLSRYLLNLGSILLIFFLVLCLCFSLALRFMTNAFSTLNRACRQVSDGDLTTNIKQESHFSEEGQIYGAFNAMIRQIRDLRIDLYEQALQVHQSKMSFLRIQIKSHFFINCLTVIYSLAMDGDTALIQEFTMCLVDYFRYLGSGFSDTVRFGSELSHLHNFVKLHQIRYPNRITYRYSVDAKLTNFELLPMIPQTFVENVFKHAMRATGSIELTIRAYTGSHNEIQGMWLEIRDNGPGFSEEQLQTLNAPGTAAEVSFDSDSGTGISNTKERLHLFYHGQSAVHFENDAVKGAIVRVFFPGNDEKEVSTCTPS